MFKVMVTLALAVGGWQLWGKAAYQRYQRQKNVVPVIQNSNASRFKCNGRIHCSQMTSCEEKQCFFCKIALILKWTVIVMVYLYRVKNNGAIVKQIGQFVMNCPICYGFMFCPLMVRELSLS